MVRYYVWFSSLRVIEWWCLSEAGALVFGLHLYVYFIICTNQVLWPFLILSLSTIRLLIGREIIIISSQGICIIICCCCFFFKGFCCHYCLYCRYPCSEIMWKDSSLKWLTRHRYYLPVWRALLFCWLTMLWCCMLHFDVWVMNKNWVELSDGTHLMTSVSG